MLATGQPETVVVTNIGILKEAFKMWAAEEAKARMASDEDVMITEKAAMEMLGKSRSTLWHWNNSGYLVCYKKGGRNEYRLSDVERVRKCLGSKCGIYLSFHYSQLFLYLFLSLCHESIGISLYVSNQSVCISLSFSND